MTCPIAHEPGSPFRVLSVRRGEVELIGIEAGPTDGPPVVLLHGFPEFSISWLNQIRDLSRAGFRVFAPDLRGYNRSSKPPRVRDYRVEELVADVVNLIDQVAGGKARLVGHDWGGIVAWYTAMWHPERLTRLVILNAPHPVAYVRELRRPAQLLRSWYAFFFQLPWLPEALIRRTDYALARQVFLQGPARKSPDPESLAKTYVEAMSQPGALTAMLNWYRAAFRRSQRPLMARMRPITLPTLLIWGDQDRYLVPELTQGLEAWVTHLRVERLPEATHWVQNDEPQKVDTLLRDFCSAD